MLVKAFKLHFTSPLHLSNVKADYAQSEQVLHSDSLTAAILFTWNTIGKEEWISDQGFVVSSLFPFTSGKTFFLPKPYVGLKQDYLDPNMAKKAKKIQFLDRGYFANLLEQTSVQIPEEHYQGKFLSSKEIDPHFMTTNERIRIMRPRNEMEDTVPYYVEEIRFKENSGLWGIAHFHTESDAKKFEVAMKILETNGLGTDRTVGYGQFTFEWTNEVDLNFPSFDTGYAINLSLYIPENAESLRKNLTKESRYEIMTRGGWISEPHNTLRKKSILMIKEGSVLQVNPGISGRIIDVTPEILKGRTSIQRSGKAIFIPLNYPRS